MSSLTIENLQVSIEDKKVIKNLSLDLPAGAITVIMGPNGSGKSTLANALMGHPSYTTIGKADLNNIDLLSLDPNERSQKGLFLSFQYPAEIEGVTVKNFLRQAVNARREKNIRISEFKKELEKNMQLLNMSSDFANRYLNKGFSGGEKKKMEILQLLMLKPKVAILDETDSGLDVDALRAVCEGILTVQKENPLMSILVITHYQRILEYLHPDHVMILSEGEIVKKGNHKLVEEIEKKGYKQFVTKQIEIPKEHK